MRVSILLFVLLTHPSVNADVQQRPAPGPPKRSQQPTPVTQTSSAIPPVTPSSSRNTPTPPSDRPGLDRSVSARTQSDIAAAQSTPDRHTSHHRQLQTHQSVNQPQPQILSTPTKSKIIANAKPSSKNSSTDLKTHHRPQQLANQAHHKPGTGLSPPAATPRRREKKNKEDESDIIRWLQQICTNADPTILYRSFVRIGVQ